MNITNTHITITKTDTELVKLISARINVWGYYNDNVLSPELIWATSRPFQGWKIVASAEDFFLAQGYAPPSLHELDDLDGEVYELAIPRMTIPVADNGYYGYYEEIAGGADWPRYLWRRGECVAEVFARATGDREQELWFNGAYLPTDEMLMLDGNAERLYIRSAYLDRISKKQEYPYESGAAEDTCHDLKRTDFYG